MYNLLRDRNDGLKKATIDFARELVRVPSHSLDEERIAGVVERKMKEVEFDKVFRDESGNVVGILFGLEAGPTVLLNSHLDTVRPRPEDSWEEPHYSGRISGGRLYGLGSADCKGGLAAQVFTGALLKRSLLPLSGNLVVAASVAEENGRSIGVRALLETTLPGLGMKPDYAILGEPTGLGLYYGHDGWVELDIRVEGSNPFHVDDAAAAIFEGLMSEHNGKGKNGGPQSAAVSSPRFDEFDGVRYATIPLTRRIRPMEELDEVLHQVKQRASISARTAGAVAVDVLPRREKQELYTGRTMVVSHVTNAWSTDPFDPLMTRARHALAAADCPVVTGKFELNRLGMGTAGSVLVKEFQLPTIAYGPGEEEQAHAVDESVAVDKVTEAVYGTAAIVHSLIGVPVCGWTSDEI